MQKHFELLGFRVRDAVTGFTGVVTTIGFDLFGCVQAIVSPGVNDKGEIIPGSWFDTNRLTATSDAPVMPVPTFAVVPGGQEHPAPPSKPVR